MGEGWLVFVASLAAVTTGQSSKPKPNFLHILLDDWGIGDVNAYGNRDTTKVQTPSIDALAAEGVLFTQGYSASPVCSPSRTAWMTSRFPAEAGIHSALGGGCGGCAQFLDPAKFVPITKLLSDAGWRTAHFGKWHLGASNANGSIPSPLPAAYGIDESATFNSDADRASPAWPPIIPGCISPRAAPGPACNDTHWAAHTSDAIVAKTLSFIDTAVAEQKPWYVNAWFHVSHAMLVPTSAQLAAYGYDEACRLGAVYSNQTTCAHQIFWAAQHAADASIKVLTDGLRARNLWTSTVVCLSTDNGPEEMMVYTNGVGSTGPFRGRKRSLYEGGVRLPFIMLYPGHSRKGVVEHTVAGAVDWLPTVMSLAGVTMPPAIAETARGYDLSGLLLDSTLGKSVHVGRRVDSRADGTPSLGPPSSAFDRPAGKPLFWEWRFPVAGPCWNEAPQLAVRTGRYKLYLNPPMSPGGTPTRVELYDVGVGSGDGTPTMLFEMQNIAAQLPEVVSNLTAQVLAWHAALPPGPVDSHPGCPGRGGPWWQTSELLDAESSTAGTPEIVIEDDPAVLL